MRNSEEKIDWIKCLIRVDSAGRLAAFTEVMHAMRDDDYWEALSFVWQTSEIVTPDLDVWKILFSSSRPGRQKLMSDAEQERLRSLPDRIKIFRGFNSQHWHRGMSWTLSKPVAYFFGHYCTSSRRAILFGADRKPAPMIAEAIVEKRFVLAYINERKEEELVIDSDCPLEKLAFRQVPRNWKFRKPGA